MWKPPNSIEARANRVANSLMLLASDPRGFYPHSKNSPPNSPIPKYDEIPMYSGVATDIDHPPIDDEEEKDDMYESFTK